MTSPYTLCAALFTAFLIASCATTPSSQDPNPTQTSGPDATEEVDPDEDLDSELLESCEELFATLNTLDTSQASPSALLMAEESADQRSELCREVFRKAAKTPGALAIADIFADLMKVRAFEIRMDRRAMSQSTQGICPDTRINIDRLAALRTKALEALKLPSLKGNERGVLNNVVQSAQSKTTSLEPFFRRTCKKGLFDPSLLITVDDLNASPSMNPSQCMDLLVAFAAFDLEQAPPKQTTRLIELLKTAQTPCLAHLKPRTDDVASYQPKDLERANQRDLMRNSFILVEMAVAMGNQDTAAMCGRMRAYLKNLTLREARLKTLTQNTKLPKDLQPQALQEYELARESLQETEANYKSICSL